MRGKFIVVEGLDGSGKGTQTALLCAYLKSQGRNVYPTAEPTESVTGGMIRDVLSGARQRTSSELAALFLAAVASPADYLSVLYYDGSDRNFTLLCSLLSLCEGF